MVYALKEWAAVVEALAAGQQVFVLRKGGIAEGKHGFQLRHSRFLLLPTWEHQQRDFLRPESHALFDRLRPDDDSSIVIRHWAEAVDVLRAPPNREAIIESADVHVWAPSYIQMRYDYRSDLPLWVITLRVWVLPTPIQLENTRFYKGCRSWVELAEDVDLTGSKMAMNESLFGTSRHRLLKRLNLRP